MTRSTRVGALLCSWRASRGMSQLRLALEAGVSARHVSFIETGRAVPSREMLLLLCETLDVPLRERNRLLDAAGYAAVYSERSLEAPELAQVKRALDFILAAHARCPALVVNGSYDVLDANEAARALIRNLVDDAAAAAGPPNLLRLLLSDSCLRPHIENIEELTHALWRRIQRETTSEENRAELQALVQSRVGPKPQAERTQHPLSVLIPIRFRVGAQTMSLFSTITTLGTPLDVTLQELRIEAMFPADPHSEALLAQLVCSSQ